MTDSVNSLARRLAAIARVKTTTLTHIGRKSGKAYQVTIWFTVDGDHINLYTMDMRRQWIQNVKANPKVTLRIGNETFQGEVTEITEPSDMKRAVELMRKKYVISIPYLWIKKRPDGAFRVRIDGA